LPHRAAASKHNRRRAKPPAAKGLEAFGNPFALAAEALAFD